MSNAEQIEYWNGQAGQRWAREDATMERLLRPVTEALLDHAAVQGSSAVDVGCGGGSQTMLLARRLGAAARVLGVDISEPMLEVARRKGASTQSAVVQFLRADAASHSFAPDSFDLLFSRFGVMFFDDPAAAFGNLRQAMRPGGRVAFCCWQSLRDNPWTFIPVQAALRHLPAPEASDPNAPGPFAFADPERVRSVLHSAGFSEVAVEPHATTLRFGEAPTLQDSVRALAEIGPVGRLLQDQPEDMLERVFVSMTEVLEPYFEDGALKLPGAVWFVTAAVT